MNNTSKHKESKTSLLGESAFTKYHSLSLDESVTESEIAETGTTVRRKPKETHTVLELKRLPSSKSQENFANDPNTVLLNEDIQDGDSLQSIALRYGCTINEIKRANGLISEQDFYARKKIKVPVNRYSLLTVPEEKLRHLDEHDKFFSAGPIRNSLQNLASKSSTQTFETSLPSQPNHSSVKNEETYVASEFDSSESLEDAPFLPTSATVRSDSPGSDANKYLKKLDKDIRKTVKKADLKSDVQSNESLSEVLSSIQYVSEPIVTPIRNRKQSNGADCGMKWWCVIICFFLILGIIIALALFEYFRSEK